MIFKKGIKVQTIRVLVKKTILVWEFFSAIYQVKKASNQTTPNDELWWVAVLTPTIDSFLNLHPLLQDSGFSQVSCFGYYNGAKLWASQCQPEVVSALHIPTCGLTFPPISKRTIEMERLLFPGEWAELPRRLQPEPGAQIHENRCCVKARDLERHVFLVIADRYIAEARTQLHSRRWFLFIYLFILLIYVFETFKVYMYSSRHKKKNWITKHGHAEKQWPK